MTDCAVESAEIVELEPETETQQLAGVAGAALLVPQAAIESTINLAKVLIKSRLLPSHIQQASDAVLLILTGAELGLQPMEAIRELYAFDGKVGMSAHAMMARLARAGVTWVWEESTDEKAVLRLKRPGWDDHVESFSIQQAQKAGLTSKGVWQKHPAKMLRARAETGGARAIAPDLLGGSIYGMDEIREIESVDATIERPKKRLSEVQREARKDDPKKFDKAMTQKRETENWSKGWAKTEAPTLEKIRDRAKEADNDPDREMIGTEFLKWLEEHLETFDRLTGYGRTKVWKLMIAIAEELRWKQPAVGLNNWIEQIRITNTEKLGASAV
ncbi:MAG: hypothetical protein AAGE52_30350 [Myxococcota bacterium]